MSLDRATARTMSLTPYWFLFVSASTALMSLIIKGEHAAEAVGAEVLDEGSHKLVAALDQQPFEIAGILKRTTVGHQPGGIDQRSLNGSRRELLKGAP
jgi:hypothetical protein